MATRTDILKKTVEIEAELRGLAAKAAEAGDWPVVRAISLASEQLEQLRSSQPARAGEKSHNHGTKSQEVAERSKPVTKRNGLAQNRPIYPRFACEGNDLVKIGWSKSEKAEYRHRASRAAVNLVVTAIAQQAAESRRFTTDDLFPVINPNDGFDVPGYQGYLILRWLRDLNLVTQRGRSGYSVGKPGSLVGSVEREWQQLPEDEIITNASGDSQ